MGIFNLTETDVTTIEPTAEEPVDEKSLIVLDGPLSSIYTKALHMAFSNESVGVLTDNGTDIEFTPENKATFLYCCDGSDITSDELTETTNKLRIALDSGKYKKVILSMECVTVNNRTALLDEYSTKAGVDVYYTSKAAINGIGKNL